MDPANYLSPFVSASSFSNGDLDPWSGGGVLKSISDTLVAIVIPDGAHHLDLRAATPHDPPDVIEARIMEESYIQKWSSQLGAKAPAGK